ncbi:MAG: Holliday junction branch migration protein RuvA [Oscillospiraceae bacterium]|jgi:Holliday junction DNA helicase RuvA
MFYYINGTVAAIEQNMAAIDCGGVAFACFTTTNTLSKLRIGEKAKLYTYSYIREDAFDLYGFWSQPELQSFRLLISVSGVGPKAAISILSSSTPEELAMSILTGNEKALTVAPGIGKKLAQRIILELKDKLSSPALSAGDGVSAAGPSAIPVSAVKEAQAALAVLGYSQSEIAYSLQGISTDGMTTEDIIRAALKRMLR